MNPVEPKIPEGSRLVTFAKDQPQYFPLPASIDSDGVVQTEWELTEEELEQLLQGGRIRLTILTFNGPLQPVKLEVLEPDCGMRDS